MKPLLALLRDFWSRYAEHIRAILRQAAWFAVSLLLALIIWVAATDESDPIREYVFSAPVTIRRANLGPDLMLVNEDDIPTNAQVTIRAPQSVWDRLHADDIDLHVDFAYLLSGEHVLPIQASFSLPGKVVNVQPSQILVQLDGRDRKTVPVHITLSGEPAMGFETRDGQPALGEVTVFGPASRVDLVTEAHAEISVEGARASQQVEVQLVARTQDEPVLNVQLDPATIAVTVPIQPQEGFNTFAVRPDIEGRPPVGYTWQLESYTPETITVAGSQYRLDSMTEAVFTEPIELWDQTESFERNVGLLLPGGVTSVTEQTVTVRITIEAIEGFKEFNEIAVESRGLPATYRVEINPQTVTMLITGPRPLLDGLTIDDVRVEVDLEGREPDTYQLPLSPIITINGIDSEQISLLPSVVTVHIIDTEATAIPTSTPTTTPTTTPTPTVIIVPTETVTQTAAP